MLSRTFRLASALVLFAASLVGAPQSARAQESGDGQSAPSQKLELPQREGLTLELGIGASVMALDNAPAEAARDNVGLAPLSLGIGGFLSPDVALTFRMTGTSSFRDRGAGLEQTVLGFYGPSLQYFVSDDLFVSGGVGLGLLAHNPFLASESRVKVTPMESRVGFAGNARIGWNFLKTKGAGLVLYAEATPARLEDVTAFGMAVGLGFQSY